MSVLRRTALCLWMLLLGACAMIPTPPPPIPEAGVPAGYPRDLYRPDVLGPGRLFRIEPGPSWVEIRVYRGGRLARLGHNHVVTSHRIQGDLFLAQHLVQSRADVFLPVASLQVDEPQRRKVLGPEFATQPSPKAVAGTRSNMLGPAVLDVGHYPYLWLTVERVTGHLPDLSAGILLRLRGVERRMTVPISLHPADGKVKVEGSFPLRQSDFGITPYSVLGGALAVKDRIDIRYHLELWPIHDHEGKADRPDTIRCRQRIHRRFQPHYLHTRCGTRS